LSGATVELSFNVAVPGLGEVADFHDEIRRYGGCVPARIDDVKKVGMGEDAGVYPAAVHGQPV
jgi:hypothetical protein